jgi:glyoxylase-like metal-dependent hydrolase (beta-lactamase superfamily II)
VDPILIVAPHASALTRGANNTYLLGAREALLIDAGAGQPAHLDALANTLAARRMRLRDVIVTHAHSDHAAGVESIHARWPEVRFLKRPWPDRDARYAVPWLPLADGDTVSAGDQRLVVVHTPGHAPDHIALWHEPTRTLFSGDLVIQGTTVVIPGSHDGSVAEYLTSLRRILALEPARLLPAHGPAIENPAPLVRAYIAHRLDRELQVLDAVQSGHASVDRIVSALYPTLDASLAPAAAESVLAHLLKLRDEGRVAREGDRWQAL